MGVWKINNKIPYIIDSKMIDFCIHRKILSKNSFHVFNYLHAWKKLSVYRLVYMHIIPGITAFVGLWDFWEQKTPENDV